MKPIVVYGIDYSLTTPAMCMMNAAAPSYDDAAYYFLTDTKKYARKVENIYGAMHCKYTSETERYYNIGTNIIQPILLVKAQDQYDIKVYLEGYSMGSKGKVFHMAENVGFLKALLWINEIDVIEVPPTTLKKETTGKGNADKDKMYEAWLAEGNPDLQDLLGSVKGPAKSPVSDIVDAHFLAKYGVKIELQRAASTSPQA